MKILGRLKTPLRSTDSHRAALLRAGRAAANMKQEEAMRRAGISETTMLAAEKGRRCTLKTFNKLSAVYAAVGVELVDGPPASVIIHSPPVGQLPPRHRQKS